MSVAFIISCIRKLVNTFRIFSKNGYPHVFKEIGSAPRNLVCHPDLELIRSFYFTDLGTFSLIIPYYFYAYGKHTVPFHLFVGIISAHTLTEGFLIPVKAQRSNSEILTRTIKIQIFM